MQSEFLIEWKQKIPLEKCKTGKIDTQTHIYITAYFPGLVQVLQEKVAMTN
jgi:hypothetical protein